MKQDSTKSNSYEKLYKLWNEREKLGLVPVLNEINRLLEQGVVSASDIAKVKAAPQKRKQSSKPKKVTRAKTIDAKKFQDWSPASIFGEQHVVDEASIVKSNALRTYGAELFQRAWQSMQYRKHINAFLSTRPFTNYTRAVKVLQRRWIKWKRTIHDASSKIQSIARVCFWRKRVQKAKFHIRIFADHIHELAKQQLASKIILRTLSIVETRIKERNLRARVVTRKFLQWKRMLCLRRSIASRVQARISIQRWWRIQAFAMRVHLKGSKTLLTQRVIEHWKSISKKLMNLSIASTRWHKLAQLSISRNFSATVIQDWYHYIRLSRHIARYADAMRTEKQQLRRACIAIQANWRRKQCESLYNTKMRFVKRLQRSFRRQKKVKHKSAQKIRKTWLVHRQLCEARKKLALLRRQKVQKEVRKIVRWWRTLHAIEQHKNTQARKLQNWFRQTMVQRKQNPRKSPRPEVVDTQLDASHAKPQVKRIAPIPFHGNSRFKFYCPAFLKHGICRRGDSCRFAHIALTGKSSHEAESPPFTTSALASNSQQPSSKQVTQFTDLKDSRDTSNHGNVSRSFAMNNAGRLYRGTGSALGGQSNAGRSIGQQRWLEPSWKIERRAAGSKRPRKEGGYKTTNPVVPPRRRKPKLAYTHLNRTILRSSHLQQGRTQESSYSLEIQRQPVQYSRFPAIS